MKLFIKLWCLGLIIAASPGMANAQTRIWAGEVRSKSASTGGTEAGVVRKETGTLKLKSTGKHSNHPIKAASRSHPEPKAKTKLKTRTKLGTQSRVDPLVQKKVQRSDNQQQSSNSSISADRAKASWQEIEGALRPAKLVVLCEKFAKEFATSNYAGEVAAIAASARRAIEIQHTAGLSGDFFEDAVGDGTYRASLRSAVRGDKEAAYRISQAYKNGASGVVASTRRMEQWLRFSAELGSGRASWEISEMYNRGGFVADAARFEQKALDLGYRPGPRLPTRGY